MFLSKKALRETIYEEMKIAAKDSIRSEIKRLAIKVPIDYTKDRVSEEAQASYYLWLLCYNLVNQEMKEAIHRKIDEELRDTLESLIDTKIKNAFKRIFDQQRGSTDESNY